MPSVSPSNAWFAAISGPCKGVLLEEDVMARYGLNADPFSMGRNSGITENQADNIVAILSHADTLDSKGRMELFDGAATPKPKGRGKKAAQKDANSAGRSALARFWGVNNLGDKVYAIVDTVLLDAGYHPQQLCAKAASMRASGKRLPFSLPDKKGMPPSDRAKDACAVEIASMLFGADAFDEGFEGTLSEEVKNVVGAILHHSWERYRKAKIRAEGKYDKAREKYIEKRIGTSFLAYVLSLLRSHHFCFSF